MHFTIIPQNGSSFKTRTVKNANFYGRKGSFCAIPLYKMRFFGYDIGRNPYHGQRDALPLDERVTSLDVTIQPMFKFGCNYSATSQVGAYRGRTFFEAPSERGLRAAVEELARMEYKSISGKEKITFYSRILPHPTSSGAPSQREPRDRANPPINSNLTCG